MSTATALARRLGTRDAVVIGLGSMIGAGVFAAFGPAAEAAGSGLLIGLLLAAGVAYCNAVASAQLAAQSVSSLCDGTESGIKRIVPYWSSAPGIDPPRSEPEAELLLLKRNPNWKRIPLLGNDLFMGVIQRIGR